MKLLSFFRCVLVGWCLLANSLAFAVVSSLFQVNTQRWKGIIGGTALWALALLWPTAANATIAADLQLSGYVGFGNSSPCYGTDPNVVMQCAVQNWAGSDTTVSGCTTYSVLTPGAAGTGPNRSTYGGRVYGACNMYSPSSTPTSWVMNVTPQTVISVNITNEPVCPKNSTWTGDAQYICQCRDTFNENTSQTGCGCLSAPPVLKSIINLSGFDYCKPIVIAAPEQPAPSCPASSQAAPGTNPIYPMRGTKVETVNTGLGVGGQSLLLTYDSGKNFFDAGSAQQMSFGRSWMSSFHQRMWRNATSANLQRADGSILSYTVSNNIFTSTSTANKSTLVASGSGYLFTQATTGVVESYNALGQLVSSRDLQGNILNYNYSTTAGSGAPFGGYLRQVIEVVNGYPGRYLLFEYTLPVGADAVTGGLISKVTDSTGRSILATYNADNSLSTLTWADAMTRTFVYENTTFPWALTGVIDENNSRYATWVYDANGRPISSQHAGGVEFTQVGYGTSTMGRWIDTFNVAEQVIYRTYVPSIPDAITVTNAMGVSATLSHASVLGRPLITGSSQPSGSGCSASQSASTFDASGNVSSKDDFTGQRSCFAYDTKNQETTRVEGLANTVACTTVLPANATLPANARKTTTIYHPDWRMPATVTMPGTITTSIYHGQPDPFNGNTVANCTTAANLPNGKPLPLLCKQVVQATLSNGALDTGTANTVTQYTYNAAGKVLSAKDSLNRTTTYTYYPSTAFTGVDPNAVGNTIGDLMSITNPAGFVTTFNAYDKAGRILKTTDPKGIVTDMTYTPRGWVSTVTTTAPGQSARTTTYTYDGVGRLTGVTNPDGSTLAYTYDAAHRLIGATDAKGNSVTYTLDNMGNRIKEDIKDPTGVLQRSINRSFDALNRLQQVSGALQ